MTAQVVLSSSRDPKVDALARVLIEVLEDTTTIGDLGIILLAMRQVMTWIACEAVRIGSTDDLQRNNYESVMRIVDEMRMKLIELHPHLQQAAESKTIN
jgi:hypothetical protein